MLRLAAQIVPRPPFFLGPGQSVTMAAKALCTAVPAVWQHAHQVGFPAAGAGPAAAGQVGGRQRGRRQAQRVQHALAASAAQPRSCMAGLRSAHCLAQRSAAMHGRRRMRLIHVTRSRQGNHIR